MPFTGAQLVTRIAIEGDDEAAKKVRGYGQVVDESRSKSDRAGISIGGMFKQALSFAGGQMIFTGLGFLKDQLGGIFTESMDAQAGLADTVNVLKSTHDASHMTAQAVLDLADKYSHLTKFSDDTVQSSENMLLTFTNIGKNVFPQATVATLDLAQKMGGDTKNAAIQLGKALNDPLTGITALTRVGVTFTQGQKDSIAAMMKHGDIASAQKVILAELSKEFGGTAVAAGKTFGGQLAIAGQRLDDVKQAIGDRLLPIATQFLNFLNEKGMPILSRLSDWIIKQALPNFLNFSNWIINQALPYLQNLANTVEHNLLPPLEDLAGNIIGLAKQFGEWLVNSGLLADAIGLVSSVLGTLVSWVSDFIAGLQDGNPLVSTLVGLLAAVGTEIGLIKLQAFAADLFASFNQLKSGAGIIANLTTQAFPALSNALGVTKTAVAGVGEAATAAEGATKVAAVGMSAAMGIATLGFSLAAGVLVTAFMMAKDKVTLGAHQMSTDVQAIYNSLGTTEADTIAKSAAKQVETMHSTAVQSSDLMLQSGSRSSAAWTSSFQKIQQASDDAKAKMILAQQQIADKAVASAARADAAWVSASQQMSLVALLAAAGWTGPQIAAYTGQGQNQFQKGPAPKGSFAEGGPVLETGLALVHKGEFVIPASLARNFSYSPGYGGAAIAPSSGGMTQVNLQINGYTFARLMLPSLVQAIRTNVGVTNL